MIEVLVALIGLIGVLLTTLITEARKGRQLLGERGKDDPTLMEVLTAIYARLGAQEVHNATQDSRLSTIEHNVLEIHDKVVDIDERVFTLEDLGREKRIINDAARKGLIDRRKDTP